AGGAGGGTTTTIAVGGGGASTCDPGTGQPVTQICLPPQGEGCPGLDWPVLSAVLAMSLGVCDATQDFSQCCDQKALDGLVGGPVAAAEGCCYGGVIFDPLVCGVGRPFVVAGAARTAEARARADWSAPAQADVSALDPATRRALAEAWSREA